MSPTKRCPGSGAVKSRSIKVRIDHRPVTGDGGALVSTGLNRTQAELTHDVRDGTDADLDIVALERGGNSPAPICVAGVNECTSGVVDEVPTRAIVGVSTRLRRAFNVERGTPINMHTQPIA